MSTILNPKYLSLPEQVQKNKNDIEIINQYLQNVYKTSSTLTKDTTSINIEDTDIDINSLNFALLIDRQGHIYKIVNVIGEVVYLSFLTNIPGGTEYNFTGEWVSDNNEYYVNDLVLYNGNLYICEANVINSITPPNIDTAHWSLFVGYGNDISEFVKNEYNKSSNTIYIEDSSQTVNEVTGVAKDGAITINGTPTSTTRLYFNIDVNLDGNYSFNGFKTESGVSQYVTQGGTTNQTLLQGSSNLTGTSNISFTNYHARQYMIYIPAGTVLNNVVIKPMLVKGSVIPPEFYMWNGEPLHPKDLEPLILWENATPNSEFSPNWVNYKKTIKTGSRVRITYIPHIDVENVPICEEFIVGNDTTGFLSFIHESNSVVYIRSREFRIQTTGLTFYAGNGGNINSPSQNNKSCVPLKIELINY